MFRCQGLSALAAFGALVAVWVSPVRGQQKPSDPPSAIAPESVARVKQATVLLKVSSEGGRSAEGSGFFAVEQGLIVTNAHVVGMLQAHSKPPVKVEVIVSSGTATERTLSGKVLGVDRSSDVALVKVEAAGNAALPAPLQFGSAAELVETQKVYVFGFPFGSELGKNITVSESSISSLRNGAKGELEQIQVNGGMHPGNSGGPVVNTRGQVVGVSVAVIRNTQINFAIPAPLVQAAFNGRILESAAGVPYRDGDSIRVPLRCECLDPLKRVRQVNVEVWSGKAAAAPDAKRKGAEPRRTDGDRPSQPLKYAKEIASGEVLLPKLGAGEVAWLQPVAVLAGGDTVRGAIQAIDPAGAVERVPADLVTKLAEQKERTVQLKAVQSLSISRGKSQYAMSQSAELPMLESFSPNPAGAVILIGFGVPRLTIEEGGQKSRPSAEIVARLQSVPPRFVIDETNRLRTRNEFNLNPKISAEVREAILEYRGQIYNAYEATTFTLPNRTVQPRETWPVKVPMLLKTAGKAEVVDLVLTCTLEGVRNPEGARSDGGGPQALVTLDGKVKGRTGKEKLDGQVAGKFGFDLKRGFISFAKMTISSEVSSPGGETQLVMAFDIDMTRAEGNPGNIALPKSATPAPAVAKKDSATGNVKDGEMPKAKEGIAARETKDPKDSKELKDTFKKPAASKEPTSYLKINSVAGDYIGQGKDYDYPGDKLVVRVTQRGLSIQVDGWNLNVGGPSREFIKVGEYPDAKRFAFSGTSPGIDFSGKGRGSNALKGAFAVWELEIKDKKVVKLALDFVQHSEGKAEGLTGKVRINSSFE